MATSSVAYPPKPDEEVVPAMLDRARGLASGIGGAAGRALGKGATVVATAAAAAARGGVAVGVTAQDDESQDAGAGTGTGTGVGAGGAGAGLVSAAPAVSGRGSLCRSRPSHHHTQGGRITKIRQRPSSSSNITTVNNASASHDTASTTHAFRSRITSTSPPPLSSPHPRRPFSPLASGAPTTTTTPTLQTPSTLTSNSSSNSSSLSASPAASVPSSSVHSSASTRPSSSAAAAAANHAMVDRDPPVLSFWGPDPVPLPSRFARIKRNLIAGHETELEACWGRLIAALRPEVEHIEGLGAHLIPSIEYGDIEDPAQASRFGHDLRRYGVGVIRKVMPKADADTAMRETVQYLESKHGIKPLPQDPTCFDFFWTPAQIRSRAHPSVLRAQRFMMGLWETSPEDHLATRLPITYVDRIRIHGSSDHRPHGFNFPPIDPPQSADDWINALQSSAGIIAQVDNGSLERWEPDGYQRGGTYDHVFHGRWEEYDPWECASRVTATMDLYNGYGACTIFRMFQGVLALSTIEPGMVRLLPSPKLATAYYLLRPFFNPVKPAPDIRSGPEWEAYLAPENWKLERDPDTIIHGAVPGHAQRITEHWHPHLHLRGSMITLPTLQPGDYIFWHPDLPYHISSNNHGLKTPSSRDEISMLVYIPAAPLTQTNALYLARQRKAFQRGHPGPDFDSSGRQAILEDSDNRPGEKDVAEAGGPAGLQAMGLAPWEAARTRAPTPPPPNDTDKVKDKDKDGEDVRMADNEERDAKLLQQETTNRDEIHSLSALSTGSRAEAEVVRLANIILFPDRSMMGYSV